jgi:hypothetical protein
VPQNVQRAGGEAGRVAELSKGHYGSSGLTFGRRRRNSPVGPYSGSTRLSLWEYTDVWTEQRRQESHGRDIAQHAAVWGLRDVNDCRP